MLNDRIGPIFRIMIYYYVVVSVFIYLVYGNDNLASNLPKELFSSETSVKAGKTHELETLITLNSDKSLEYELTDVENIITGKSPSAKVSDPFFAGSTNGLGHIDDPKSTQKIVRELNESKRNIIQDGKQYLHENFLMSHLIDPGDLVVYIGKSIKHQIVHYAELVGKVGNIIGIEISFDAFPSLIQAVNEAGYENNVLLMNSIIRHSYHDNLHQADEILSYCYDSTSEPYRDLCQEYLKLSISRLYDITGRVCPKYIVLQHDEDYPKNIVDFLSSGIRMIQSCSPVIYVDNVTPSISHALISVLTKCNYLHIYWHIEVTHSDDPSVLTDIGKIGLLAYHQSKESNIKQKLVQIFGESAEMDMALFNTFGLLRYRQGEYYLSQVKSL